MTKAVLLLLALYGLRDDDFRFRQASERYLAASGYTVVPLNRLAPRLTSDRQTRATLKKLEKRYYAAWDAKLARNDWSEYPSLSLISPWCVADHGRFPCWGLRRGEDPFYPLWEVYVKKAWARRGQDSYPTRNHLYGFGHCNAATLELCRDLRARGAPAWAEKALLSYLRWRVAYRERVGGIKDVYFVRRDR